LYLKSTSDIFQRDRAERYSKTVLRAIPNLLTSIRLVVSPLLVWLLLQHRFREALAAVLLAGATDWFDGWAARRLNVSGRLGVVLDPIADKTMLVTVFVTLGYMQLIPRWMLYMAVGRDLIIVVGAILLRIFRNVRRFVPSVLGKVSTFFQITLFLMVLIHASFDYPLLLWLTNTALALTALFTGLSGIDYIRQGIEMTRQPPR
jgi:cardiolipin synthase